MLFYHLMAAAMGQGGEAIYLDIEGRHSMGLARLVSSTGLEGIKRVKATSLEQALDLIKKIITQFLELFYEDPSKCPPYVLCVDSVAQLGSQAEAEAGEVRPLIMAQQWAAFLRGPWLKDIINTPFYLLMSNQPKEDLNFQSYGPKKTREPGGKGLMHAYSLQIAASSSSLFQTTAEKTESIGFVEEGKDLTYKLEKNCEGFPGVSITIPFFYRFGVDNFRAAMNFICSEAYQKLRGSAWVKSGSSWTWVRTGQSKFRGAWNNYFTEVGNKEALNQFLSDVEVEFLHFLRLEP